jgi:hypothetical protein
MHSVQAPGSTAWQKIGDQLAAANAEWLAWSSEGQTMARIDMRLDTNSAAIRRADSARSPWPAVAAITGSLGGLLGLDWLLFAPPAWLPVSALLCLAAAGTAVVLTSRARAAAAGRLADLRAVRADLRATRAEVIARYRHQAAGPEPVSYAGTAAGGES